MAQPVYAAPPPQMGVAMVQMPGQIGIAQPYGLDVQITNQSGQTISYGQQPSPGVTAPAVPYFAPQQQTLFAPTYAQPPMGYAASPYGVPWQPYGYPPPGVSGSSGPYPMYSQPQPNPYLPQSQGFGAPFGSTPSSANQPPSGGAPILLPQYINSPPNGPGARVPAATNGAVGSGGGGTGAAANGTNGAGAGAGAAAGNRSGGSGGAAGGAAGANNNDENSNSNDGCCLFVCLAGVCAGLYAFLKCS